jgi:hypothetical protein
VGILRWTQRLRVIFVFVDPPVSALFSFLFFSLFLLGLIVLRPQQFVVSCGCYINIAGRKPVSRYPFTGRISRLEKT